MITDDGAAGQVTLHPGNGQCLRQMRQVSVGDAQISFSVFEVDGIHLMRHSAGAHLTTFSLLTENTSADVVPNIPAEIQQNGIHPDEIVVAFSQRVIRLDLSGDKIRFQPK